VLGAESSTAAEAASAVRGVSSSFSFELRDAMMLDSRGVVELWLLCWCMDFDDAR
jgi:hypothetical protein